MSESGLSRRIARQTAARQQFMQFHSDEVRLLAQLGLMAIGRREESIVSAIFAAIELLRPQSSIAFVGLAMNHLYAGRVIEAVCCLERGLETVDEQDRPELHALLAMACHFEGRPAQCERALSQAGDVPIALALRRQVSGEERLTVPAT